jgi:hypothetical protein
VAVCCPLSLKLITSLIDLHTHSKRQIVFGDEKMGGDLAEIAFQEELYYSKHGVPPQSSLAHFVTTEMGCKCVIS